MTFLTKYNRPQRSLSPWEVMDEILRESGGNWLGQASESALSPAVDVAEDKDGYVVTAELPGVEKKDVQVTLEDGVLTLSGKKENKAESDDQGVHWVERSYGSFSRSFRLVSADPSGKAKAEFKDGILEIRVPKAPEAKARTIEVS